MLRFGLLQGRKRLFGEKWEYGRPAVFIEPIKKRVAEVAAALIGAKHENSTDLAITFTCLK